VTDYGLGAIPSPADARDYPIVLDTAAPLPSRFVSTLLPPPLNQHTSPMCVAFASAGVKGWEERRDGHGFLAFDPAWLYPRAQAIDGIPGPHDGTTIRAALRVMKSTGYALVAAPQTTNSYRIAAYYAVPQTEDGIKRAILQSGPVLIGTLWYGPWFRPVKGILPAPSGAPVGGHARYAFGWDDAIGGGSFYVRNSWGSLWGINGNSHDPYRYILPALHDAWRAVDVLGD
jgi:hypothetical protein